MYAALWRLLPGPTAVKALEAFVLFLVALLVLFQWVFPWISPYMPFNDTTVDSGLGVLRSGGGPG